MKKYLFGFVLLLFYACSSDKAPKHLIGLMQMRELLWQMSVADQVAETDTARAARLHQKDSITKFYEQILKDNNVSETDYKKSLNYYISKPNLMKQLTDTTAVLGKAIADSFRVKYKPKPKIEKIDSAKKDTTRNKKIVPATHIAPLPLTPNRKFNHPPFRRVER